MSDQANRSADRSTFEVDIPLHAATANGQAVADLVQSLLMQIERYTRSEPNVDHTDVLQALSIATAVRAAVAEAPLTAESASPISLLGVSIASAGADDQPQAMSYPGNRGLRISA